MPGRDGVGRLVVVVRELEDGGVDAEDRRQDRAVQELDVERAEHCRQGSEARERGWPGTEAEAAVGKHAVDLARATSRRRQRLHLERPAETLVERPRQRAPHEAVRGEDHHALLLHVCQVGEDVLRGLVPALLVAVLERGLVAVMAVGDDDGLGRERCFDARDRGGIRHPPELVPAVHVDDRLAERPDELAHRLARARVEAEDRAQVGGRGEQDREAVGLGAGERALVRADDARAELLEPEPAEEAVAPAARAVGQAEALGVEVDRRRRVAHEEPARHPLAERARRRGAAIRLLGQDEPDHVVRAPRVELGLLARRDDIVGRRQHEAQVAGAGRVVAKALERADDGHLSRPRAPG